MRNKRLVNALQNAALLLLTASALFLLLQTPLLSGGWTARLPFASPAAVLTPQPVQESEKLGDMLGSVHIMVTDDSEYGRYGQLCVGRDDALLQQLIPLLREALGSAAEMEAATHQAFREALDGASIYIDLLSELPLAAIGACLGEQVESDRPIRAAALAAEEEGVYLYLQNNSGGLFRCATALPVSALGSICAGVSPNGSSFAFESNYTALSPYTILAAQVQQPPDVQADLPVLYSSYNLLTALDFNAHTNSRYIDRDGAEVVEESPRTLRVGPDGTVVYSSAGAVSLPLYRVPLTGERPGLTDSLRTAWALADALVKGTGASPLYLHTIEDTETGYIIRFRYQAEGIPVYFTDEADALAVEISGGAAVGFVYRCRSYTAVAEEGAQPPAPLLPPAMATAIATLYPDSGLALAYVDGGSSPLSATWLRS